jgi:hypothetical protein
MPISLIKCNKRHPDVFKKLIQNQTQVWANIRVIVLNNIGQDAMYYLSNHINAVAGVHAILPANFIEKNGKFKISVLEKRLFEDSHSLIPA